MFTTLEKAIANQSDYIIAEDISTSGQKHFYTGTLEQLQLLYDRKETHHWYECLREHRPSRLFLDVDSTVPVDILHIVAVLKTCLYEKFKMTEPGIEILNSSGTNKYSWHLIVTNVILENVYHVGAFVRRLVLYMQDDPMASTIDTAVYTRNRMFRLPGSSKLGSTRVLQSDKQWWELLVQVPCRHPLVCLEIDESVPVSTSQKPQELFYIVNETWTRRSPYCSLSSSLNQNTFLSPIFDWLDKYEHAQIIRHKIKLLETGFYVVPAKSRKCYIANRTHKGNAIWYMIDMTSRKIYQRCLDDDCGKRQHLMTVTSTVWNKWSQACMYHEPPPNNKNTLYSKPY